MATKTSKAPRFIVLHNGKEWGPIPWQNLREWLGLGWLPRNIHVRYEDTPNAFAPASDFEKLWKIAGRDFIAEDQSIGLASAKFPISPALKRYLIDELGWPGEVNSFNYYNADKLRKTLEKIFPDPTRDPLDDPDWPSCWSGGSPAEQARETERRRAEPITEAQRSALAFFNKADGVTTKGKASDILDAILSDEAQREAWEAEKDKRNRMTPATEAQWVRLRFAANKLHKQLPKTLSKADASSLIEKWYEGNDALEDAYQDYKISIIEKENEEIFYEIDQEERSSARTASSQKGTGCLGILIVSSIMTLSFTVTNWI